MENHRENKQQYRVKEQFDFVKQEVIRRDGDRREKNIVSERASERAYKSKFSVCGWIAYPEKRNCEVDFTCFYTDS